METYKASINRNQQDAVLALQVNKKRLDLKLTEDNPNNVKEVFNNLLKELKAHDFKFDLDDKTEDLYYHLCKEYIIQLNSELKAVRRQLEENELIEVGK